ncbi:MAG: Ig-like domain-containing protein [Coriobacteriia bacterium]|nr:Ig-like domain-containing protein [Coriobacteriia bacterium]
MGQTASCGQALANSGIQHVSSCVQSWGPSFGVPDDDTIAKGSGGNILGVGVGETTIPVNVGTNGCAVWNTCAYYNVPMKVKVKSAVAFGADSNGVTDQQMYLDSFTGTIPNPGWTKNGQPLKGFYTEPNEGGDFYAVGDPYDFTDKAAEGIRLYASYVTLEDRVKEIVVELYMGQTASCGQALANSGIEHVSSCVQSWGPSFGTPDDDTIAKGSGGNILGVGVGETTIPVNVGTNGCGVWATCAYYNVPMKVKVKPAVALGADTSSVTEKQMYLDSFKGTMPNPGWTNNEGVAISGFSTEPDGKGTFYPIGSQYDFSDKATEGIRLYAVYKIDPTFADFSYVGPADLTYSGTPKAATVGYATGITQADMGAFTVYYVGTTRTTGKTYGPSTTAPTEAGTYSVYVTPVGGNRYFGAAHNANNPVLSNGISAILLGGYTINPAEVAIVDPVDTIADATVVDTHNTYTTVDGVNGEKFTVKYDYADAANAGKNADVDTPNVLGLTWNATIPDPKDNNNYVLNPLTGTNGHLIYHVDGVDTNNEYDVAPTINVSDTAVYGDSFDVTPSTDLGAEFGKLVDTEWTITVNDENGALETVTVDSDAKATVPGTIPAGEYTVEASYVKNYLGSEDEPLVVRGTISQKITVTKRPLTVNAAAVVVDKTYDLSKVVYQDAAAPSKTLQFGNEVLQNVVKGDTVAFTAEGTYDSEAVGARTITLTGIELDADSAKNYTLAETAQGNGTISKAPATVVTAEYGYIYINDTMANHGPSHPSIADVANVTAKAMALNEETMTFEEVDVDVAPVFALKNTVHKPAGLEINAQGQITKAATVTTNQNVEKRYELWPVFTVTVNNNNFLINNNGTSTDSVEIPFAVLGKGEYTINLNLNNDDAALTDADWEATYLKRDGKELPTAEAEGYTFVGWFANADLSGEAVTEVPAGSEGAKTFYAKWMKNITNADVKVVAGDGAYGTPDFTVAVKDGSTVLTEGTDYSVEYATQTEDGVTTVTVTVTGLEAESTADGVYAGGYDGARTETFTFQNLEFTFESLTPSELVLNLNTTLGDDVEFTNDELSVIVNGQPLDPSDYTIVTDGENGKVTIQFKNDIASDAVVEIAVNKEGFKVNEGTSFEAPTYDEVMSDEAKDLIGAIGDIKYNDSTKDKIEAARDAYDALTDDQKAMVPADQLQALIEAEAAYQKLDTDHKAADAANNAILEIGTIEPTDDVKAKIEAAREAYDALTDDQKALLPGDRVAALEFAEKKYVEVKDQAAADEVASEVGSIGNVELTDEFKAQLDAAREAYDKLTDEQKAVFPAEKLEALEAAEQQYAKLAGDKALVDNTVAKIDKIEKVEFTKTCKAEIEAARKAYDALSDELKAVVPAEQVKALVAAEKAFEKLQIADNKIKMDAKLKVSAKGNTVTVAWGKVAGAKGYLVYANYCGKKITKPVKTIKDPNTVSYTITKLNGKKLDQKKNFKLYVTAYKLVKGKKVAYGKTITAHFVGAKNTNYSNAKAVKLITSNKVTLKKGKTSKVKAKVELVNSKKKPLSANHAKTLRFASSNKKVATVDASGKITAKAKGTCSVYVYAKNGYAKKVTVTVK